MGTSVSSCGELELEQGLAHHALRHPLVPPSRGLHTSTFQLNLSRFCHWQTDATQHVLREVLTLS